MGDYTLLNLRRDVEDMAPKFDMSPGLEGRFARDDLDSEQSGISYQRLEPGFRMPFGIEVIAFGARGLLNDDVDMTPGWWSD